MRTLRIFISSPADVQRERHVSERVMQRLTDEYSPHVFLDAYSWEYEPMRFSEDFQSQIEPISNFDLVVCILWSRLGTPLLGPDGRTYKSGTEYEIDGALQLWADRGSPEVVVYHNQSPVTLPRTPREEREKAYRQLEELEEFLEARSIDRVSGTIKGAIIRYENLGQFETFLERHLRKFVEKRFEAFPATATVVQPSARIWSKGSPFRGLEVFESEHEAIFFGRTKAIGEVLDQLRRQVQRLDEWRSMTTSLSSPIEEPKDSKTPGIFVLISAISGVGKSSLVRAGVLPLLTKRGVVEGVDLWRRAVMRPSESNGDVFDGLVQALVRAEALPELTSGGDSAAYLASRLRQNPGGADFLISQALARVEDAALKDEQEKLRRVAEEIGREGRSRDQELYEESLRSLRRMIARLVLVVDQFEEIFTIPKIVDATRIRIDFVSALAGLARSGKVWVILTLRSDFFSRCSEIAELMTLKQLDGHYDLQPPTKEEIGEIIRKSAAAAGLRYERSTQAGNDVSLDELLRDAMIDNPASLPLLEFCLDELYKRRSNYGVLTLAAYDELGRLDGSIEKRAEAIYSSLDVSAQSAFDHVMRGVTTIGLESESAFSRRWADYEQLTNASGAKEFVDEFLAPTARLFVADRTEDGRAVVSVAHEALLTAWKRLYVWLLANQESLQVRAYISSISTQWKESSEEEKNGYLLHEGLQLERSKDALRRGYLESNEVQFVEASLSAVENRKSRENRRRKAAFITIAVALVLALIFGAISLWQAHKATEFANRERAARSQAEQSAKAAQFLSKQRERSADSANQARSEADTLINDLFSDLKNKLTPLGGLGLLTEPAKKVREYFEKLPKDEVTTERLLEQRSAFDAVGDVFALTGNYDDAVASYEEALKLSNAFAGLADNNIPLLRNIVQTHVKLGDVYSAQRRRQEALRKYQEAERILETLLANNPNNNDFRLDMSSVYQKIGDASGALGDSGASLKDYDQSVAIVRQLLIDDPKNVNSLRVLEIGLNKIGNFLRLAGRSNESLKFYLEALEIAERLISQDERNQFLEGDLILCRYWTGLALASSQDLQSKEKGKVALQQALEMTQSYIGTERDAWKSEISKALQTLFP